MVLISPPKVSVILFCKDRINSIKRSVNSVLNQQWPNLEYVVQDGMSTDGTLDFLKSYGSLLDIISVKDTVSEAFWNTLRRCTGKYIASCLSDEEMLPHALEDGISFMESNLNAGAVTRDALLTDISGNVVGEALGTPFDLFEYMSARQTPHFSASIFRREALLNIGLHNRKWDGHCGEFELWCRLFCQYQISYLSGYASKYAVHSQQLSNNPINIMQLIQARLNIIDNIVDEYHVFAKSEKLLCKAETVLLLLFHLDNLGYHQQARHGLIKNMIHINNAINASLDSVDGDKWCAFCYLLQKVGLWSSATMISKRILSHFPEIACSRSRCDLDRGFLYRFFYKTRQSWLILKPHLRVFLSWFNS